MLAIGLFMMRLQKTATLPSVTQAAEDCRQGYAGCNNTLADQAFRELTVNFTWSNETRHLRIDLDNVKEDLRKCRRANETLVTNHQKDKEDWDSDNYSLQNDNRFKKKKKN